MIFSNSLAKYEEQVLRDKLAFLGSLKVFSEWGFFLLNKLYFSLDSKKYYFGTTIAKEGDPCTQVFIVKSGYFKVICTCLY